MIFSYFKVSHLFASSIWNPGSSCMVSSCIHYCVLPVQLGSPSSSVVSCLQREHVVTWWGCLKTFVLDTPYRYLYSRAPALPWGVTELLAAFLGPQDMKHWSSLCFPTVMRAYSVASSPTPGISLGVMGWGLGLLRNTPWRLKCSPTSFPQPDSLFSLGFGKTGLLIDHKLFCFKPGMWL